MLRRRGAPMIGADAEDLIQHAITCFLEGIPAFDPNTQDLFKYLSRRMSNKVQQLREDRKENKPIGNFSINDETATTSPLNVVEIEKFRREQERIETQEKLIRFLIWLQKDARYADLIPLASIIIYEWTVDVSQQALALGVTQDHIYRLQKRLRDAMKRFESSDFFGRDT